MINILIVDDDNDKIGNVITSIRDKYDDFNIEVVVDSISAQRLLIEKKFDLLILDLNLPFRIEDKARNDGGKILLQEINRNQKIQSPAYVVGLTQFTELSTDFSAIWSVINYDPSDLRWSSTLLEIITHIVKTKKNASLPTVKIESIFVEGKTDKKVVIDAIKIFFPDYINRVIVKNSEGAAFVARDIIIWGKTLAKNKEEIYIKSVGMLDGDFAGDEAKIEIDRVIPITSAEFKTFKVFQLSKKYAKHLVPLYSKGLKIPIAFEELFGPEHWKIAQSKGWLEKRQDIDDFITDPKSWDKFNMSLGDYLQSLEFNTEEIIYVFKFKKVNKDDFAKYLISLDLEAKKHAYANVKYLLNDILETLFPNDFKK